MSETIVSLLNEVANDEVVLPAIQRDFVWPSKQVVRLMDSILRGYPIGLILLWETYSDIQYRSFTKNYRSTSPHAFTDNSSQKRIKLVLDGQQRLQSLYVALYGTYERKSLYFDVLSGFDTDDLADDRFIIDFMTAADAKASNGMSRDEFEHGVPPYLYVKTAELFEMDTRSRRDFEKEWTKKKKLSDEEVDLLQENISRFADHLASKNILKTSTVDADLVPTSKQRKSEADVCEIFVRINREGTNLSRSDLIFSLLKLNWKESAEALPEFVRTINKGNSFGIEDDFVIRCLFTVSDLGAKMDLDLLRRKSNVRTLQQNFDRCCDAIRAAVDFAQQDCKCASARLIGGINTLVPFVYYFFHAPNREAPNNALADLRRGFYLFGFSRSFSRYADSHINTFVKWDLQPRLAEGNFTFPFKKAARRVASWEKVTDLDLQFLQRNVDLALHLVQSLSGSKVQYDRNSPEIDHIFPKATLRDKGHDDNDINTLANYWILAQGKNRNKSDKHPADYFADVDDSVIATALIERPSLHFGRYKKFLRTRGAGIFSKVKALAQWPDAPFTLALRRPLLPTNGAAMRRSGS